jgi:hypothetical protein
VIREALGKRGVLAFALRVVAWGVALFALWFFAARPVSLAVAWGAAALLQAAAPVERARPRWVEGRVSLDMEVDATTTYRQRMRPGAIFEIPVNPLKQTFGLPFFLALLLASRPARVLRKAALGVAVLLPFAAFGVACEVALALAHIAGPAGGTLVDLNAFETTLAALGFQLGTLIFPTVVPVVLWAAMDPLFLRAASQRAGANGKFT